MKQQITYRCMNDTDQLHSKGGRLPDGTDCLQWVADSGGI